MSTSLAAYYGPTPEPVWQPSLRAGEMDGRYFDCTPDLGPTGDTFPSLSVLSVAITRVDGNETTSADLQSAGSEFPSTLDSTGLIPTFGFIAPITAEGVLYKLTLTADKTTQNRLFIRDWIIRVVSSMG